MLTPSKYTKGTSTGLCRHPDYEERILCFRDFINRKQRAYDDASHGTHVAGIIGGDGKSHNGLYRGIAPGCGLIGVKVLDQWGQGKLEDLIQGIEWVMDNRSRYDIRIMNISAGTTKDVQPGETGYLLNCVEQAWDAGIAVVVAAGNMGPEPESITVPGNSRKVITVGSSDVSGSTRTHRFSEYSGCGPTSECICKPEFVTPGTEIVSCHISWKQGRFYSAKSGTSMAAPSIAGAVALLLEQDPKLTNFGVKMRLKESAGSLGLPKNRQGWGMPDLRKLILA